MLAKVLTCAVVGLDGAMVEVEVDDSFGVPLFAIVGLPDAAVQEARERVRSAVRNSNCAFPLHRIIVNMAPADLKKEGPALPTGRPSRRMDLFIIPTPRCRKASPGTLLSDSGGVPE